LSDELLKQDIIILTYRASPQNTILW